MKKTAVDQVSDLLGGSGGAPQSGNGASGRPGARAVDSDAQAPRGGQRRPRSPAAGELEHGSVGEDEGEDDERQELGDDDSGQDDASDQDEGGEGEEQEKAQEKESPVTVRELAEQLGVTARDVLDVSVYMGLEDPDDKKSPRVYQTIGELRDQAQEFAKYKIEHGELAEERGDTETQRAAAVRELAYLSQILEAQAGRPITPALRAAAQEFDRQRLEREQTRLGAALPAWRDDKVRETDRSAIREYAAQFGFSESEIAGVSDHRIVLMLRRAALDWKATRAAGAKRSAPKLEAVKPARHPGARGSGNSLRAKIQRARTGGKQDKIAAVSAILAANDKGE